MTRGQFQLVDGVVVQLMLSGGAGEAVNVSGVIISGDRGVGGVTPPCVRSWHGAAPTAREALAAFASWVAMELEVRPC